MTDTMRMWTEIIFNLAYLAGIYLLVGLMSRSLRRSATGNPEKQRMLRLFRTGFLLLAIGDTGHVGFRVLAYFMGGLESRLIIGGASIPLVGLGALSTAYTVTLLYMIFVEIWRRRFDRKIGPLYIILMAFGIARLIIMAFPQNEWSRVVPLRSWSLIRNGLLTVLGLGIATMTLIDSVKHADSTFRNLAICIFVSYAFYIPVILFVQHVPVIGMLMIPKTLAYIVMAWIGYRRLFRNA